MIKREFQLVNKLGLHARPASLLVTTAEKFKSSIDVRNSSGEGGDAKKIMCVIVMAIECGQSLFITINGPDEKEAMAALEDLIINKKFNEE
jgi:phosphocarrier protein